MRFVPLLRAIETGRQFAAWRRRRRELRTIRRKVGMRRTTPVVFSPPFMQLEFHPEDSGHPWRTLHAHEFRNGVFSVSVPAGFETDLASVPNWLLWIFSPFGRHQRAGLFHDAAYSQQPCSRSTADQIFRSILEHDGIAYVPTIAMYYAVRIFGRRHWRRNA